MTEDKTRQDSRTWYRYRCQSQSQSPGSQPTAHLFTNPAVSCHYFLPGPWLTSKLQSITGHSPVTDYTTWYRGTQVTAWIRNSPESWHLETTTLTSLLP